MEILNLNGLRQFFPFKPDVFKWILLSSEYVEKYFSINNVTTEATLMEKYPNLF